ncbi:DHA2 family efflux MFS transporter permease subunit [Streptomyces sp. NPDC058257]|uniref:DHA2 family efflux MFS transporter permease subunit n=1 Tax=Streptomyces sp. NPDC058257 TaxID=3346409 RepID=UPI0036F1385E
MKTDSAPERGTAHAGASAPAATAPPDPRRWWVLGVISLAQFVIAIDSSVVNVMGPRLKESIGLSTTGLQWVMNIYVLLFGGLLLLGGRLADVVGRRLVFLAGLALFTLASLGAGLADSEGALLAARALQGIGAAALSPASLSILVTVFPDTKERAKAFGVWGAVIGIGASTGTIMGGAIVNVDWRWAFWINVPVGLAVGAAALVLVKALRPSGERPAKDLAGAVTATGGLLLLVYAIVTSGDHGWADWRTLGAFAVAVALLIAFVVVEGRSKAPLVPLRLFRSRSVVAGGLGEFLTAAIMMPIFFLLPLWMQGVLGYSPLRTGLAYLPVSIALMVLAPLASTLIGRTGPRNMYLAGTVALAGCVVMLIGLPVHTGYWSFLLPATTLFGVGLVFCLIPTPVVGTSEATDEDAGTTSALLNASTQIGAAFGIAVAVTVLNNKTASEAAHGANPDVALVNGLQSAFTVLLVFLVLSVLTGLFGFRRGPLVPAGTPSTAGGAAEGTTGAQDATGAPAVKAPAQTVG